MTGIIFEHSGGKEHQRAPNKDNKAVNKAVNHQNRLPHQENPFSVTNSHYHTSASRIFQSQQDFIHL